MRTVRPGLIYQRLWRFDQLSNFNHTSDCDWAGAQSAVLAPNVIIRERLIFAATTDSFNAL
jgi:hypothetical protein